MKAPEAQDLAHYHAWQNQDLNLVCPAPELVFLTTVPYSLNILSIVYLSRLCFTESETC